MDFSEKWGTDVETAVKLALDDLKLTRDEVDVTVLEDKLAKLRQAISISLCNRRAIKKA